MTIPSWQDLLSRNSRPCANRLLALDPGGTTGYAVFQCGQLQEAGQVPGYVEDTQALLDRIQPTEVVCEAYKVYKTHLDQHTGSDVPTLRLIGAIELLCSQRSIPLEFQMASQAKGFSKDEHLKVWGMWQPGAKRDHVHAHDAIRHGTYYLLFGKRTHD